MVVFGDSGSINLLDSNMKSDDRLNRWLKSQRCCNIFACCNLKWDGGLNRCMMLEEGGMLQVFACWTV